VGKNIGEVIDDGSLGMEVESSTNCEEVEEGEELIESMTPVKTTETTAMETKVQTSNNGKEMVNDLTVLDQKNSMVTPVKKSTTGTQQYPTEKFRQLYSVNGAWENGKKIQAISSKGMEKNTSFCF
jgi:hypothetical protein